MKYLFRSTFGVNPCGIDFLMTMAEVHVENFLTFLQGVSADAILAGDTHGHGALIITFRTLFEIGVDGKVTYKQKRNTRACHHVYDRYVDVSKRLATDVR